MKKLFLFLFIFIFFLLTATATPARAFDLKKNWGGATGWISQTWDNLTWRLPFPKSNDAIFKHTSAIMKKTTSSTTAGFVKMKFKSDIEIEMILNFQGEGDFSSSDPFSSSDMKANYNGSFKTEGIGFDFAFDLIVKNENLYAKITTMPLSNVLEKNMKVSGIWWKYNNRDFVSRMKNMYKKYGLDPDELDNLEKQSRRSLTKAELKTLEKLMSRVSDNSKKNIKRMKDEKIGDSPVWVFQVKPDEKSLKEFINYYIDLMVDKSLEGVDMTRLKVNEYSDRKETIINKITEEAGRGIFIFKIYQKDARLASYNAKFNFNLDSEIIPEIEKPIQINFEALANLTDYGKEVVIKEPKVYKDLGAMIEQLIENFEKTKSTPAPIYNDYNNQYYYKPYTYPTITPLPTRPRPKYYDWNTNKWVF